MMQNKMNAKRLSYILIVGFSLIAIMAAVSTANIAQKNDVSFTSLFKVAGQVPQTASRSVTKMLPIDSVDEGELGQTLKRFYSTTEVLDEDEKKSLVYLQSLVKVLQSSKQKSFDYSVSLMRSEYPNAMALPGGVIIVTTGLLKTLKSESEIYAVLAHEMGHIELSHCLDSVKYEIVSKKILHNNLGSIADFTRNLLIRHSFSKTQEDEADNYGFKALVQSDYDPTALARSFTSLQEHSTQSDPGSINPLRDYFMSHPPLPQRVAKFDTDAQIWWQSNANIKRYIGIQNFKEKIDLVSKNFGDSEYVTRYVK